MTGASLFTTEKGPPGGTAVLCIHGLLGSSRNVAKLVDGIAHEGYRALAFDQRGHGHSPHQGPYSLLQLARDVEAVLNSKNIDRAHLVGHSLGARVALEFASMFPTRALSLCMIDASFDLSEAAHRALSGIVDSLPLRYPSRESARIDLERFGEAMQKWFASNLRISDQGYGWNFDLPGIRDRLMQDILVSQADQWKRLTCPTMILRGALSEHFSQQQLERMLELNPRARFEIIPRAAHWVHVDNPVDTLAAVTRFLKEISP